MTMTARRNSASVTIQEPISIASSTVSLPSTLELLQRVGAAIGEDQHRTAHRCDVHGRGLRNTGRGELRIPRAASVSDSRSSIRAPALDLHHLPDVEPLLRRRSERQVALPTLQKYGADNTQGRRNQALQWHAGIEPRGCAAKRKRDADH